MRDAIVGQFALSMQSGSTEYYLRAEQNIIEAPDKDLVCYNKILLGQL